MNIDCCQEGLAGYHYLPGIIELLVFTMSNNELTGLDDWMSVMFTDESRFNLNSADGCQHVW